MSKYKKEKTKLPQAEEDAIKIAHGIQKNGQTKEQTKLITQGIQKGIELYKKKQNVKNRELDKNRKLANKQKYAMSMKEPDIQVTHNKVQWLPWVLLGLTWLGIGIYFSVY